MSSSRKVAGPTPQPGAAQQAAGETAAATKDEAKQVGATAASAASDVAGTTKEQAGAVAGEAVTQVRGLLDQTRQKVSEQAGGAQQKLGESLRGIVDELRAMGDGSGSGSGPAAEVVRALADRGSVAADYVASKQPAELVQDLRQLAARRPGGFLLGALVAGIAAGRATRGAQADASTGSPSGSAVSGRPVTPLPPAAVGTVPADPLPLDAGAGVHEAGPYPTTTVPGGGTVPGLAPHTPGTRP